MDTRSVCLPPRASRTALLLALLVAGAVLPAASSHAQNFWRVGLPPDQLLRLSPRTPGEVAEFGRALARGKAQALALAPAPPAPLPATESGDWRPMAAMGSQYFHESVIDPATRRVVLFGGVGDPLHNVAPPELVRAAPLDGGPWAALGQLSAESPQRRWNMAVALDPARHALLVFGGQALDGTGNALGDLWSLSLEQNGTWTRLTPAGPAPAPRRFASLVYDAPRDRFLLAGGFDNYSSLSEVWELKLAPAPEWRRLALTGEPGLWLGAVLADPATGAAWWVVSPYEIHPLTIDADTVTAQPGFAIGTDPADFGPPEIQLAGFDPDGHRLLWFERENYSTRVLLDRPRWFELDEPREYRSVDLTSAPPASRYLFASNWDAEAGRLVLTGGYDDDETYFGDAWQFQVSEPLPTAASVSLRDAESDERGVRIAWRVLDATGARSLVQRSNDGVAWEDAGEATWSAGDELSWRGPALDPGARVAYRLTIGPAGSETRTPSVWLSGPADARLSVAPFANPGGPDLALRLSLRPGLPAELRVLDAGGRSIARSRLAPGTSTWSLGRAAAPGVYFAELIQGTERRVVRLVSLR